MPEIWAEMDIGKEHHHCVVIDGEGRRLLSQRVLNGQAELTALIEDVLAISPDVLWAVDLNHGGAALLIGLLLHRDQPIAYLTGFAVHRASGLRPGDEIAVNLCTLTARRLDVVFDRTRAINRLRAQLLEIFPALERALELVNKGPLVLLTGYQTPAAIRRAGTARIEAWLRKRKVRSAAALARTATAAAEAQSIALPGEAVAAAMVARLAHAVTHQDQEIAELDALIEKELAAHPYGQLVRSLPGMGANLAAEFLAATGGQLEAFGSADRLAGFAGLAPGPRDSGRISGNLRRPRRYHRGLLRSMYLSAMVSIACCPSSKAFYQRKRAEGRGHKQAMLALARRRLNVLWAMIRDGVFYHESPPVTAVA